MTNHQTLKYLYGELVTRKGLTDVEEIREEMNKLYKIYCTLAPVPLSLDEPVVSIMPLLRRLATKSESKKSLKVARFELRLEEKGVVSIEQLAGLPLETVQDLRDVGPVLIEALQETLVEMQYPPLE